MDIAMLNKKVTFQKNTVVTDEIGNHTNSWEDYYTCKATVSGEGGDERLDAGTTAPEVDLSFTVRYCDATKVITTTDYRVVMDEAIYDILAIDHFSYKKQALKFKCQKVRR